MNKFFRRKNQGGSTNAKCRALLQNFYSKQTLSIGLITSIVNDRYSSKYISELRKQGYQIQSNRNGKSVVSYTLTTGERKRQSHDVLDANLIDADFDKIDLDALVKTLKAG